MTTTTLRASSSPRGKKWLRSLYRKKKVQRMKTMGTRRWRCLKSKKRAARRIRMHD